MLDRHSIVGGLSLLYKLDLLDRKGTFPMVFILIDCMYVLLTHLTNEIFFCTSMVSYSIGCCSVFSVHIHKESNVTKWRHLPEFVQYETLGFFVFRCKTFHYGVH